MTQRLAYGIPSVQGEQLAQCGRWTLVRGAEPRRGDLEAALEEVMVHLLPRAASTIDRRMPAPGRSASNAPGIIIVLGGDRERDYWDTSGTLAFHAIGTGEPGATGFAVAPTNERNVGVVALDAMAEAMSDDQHDGSLELALSVLPIAMFMVAAWLQASDGLTPLEVAQRGGTEAIDHVCRRAGGASKGRGHPDGLCEEAAQIGLVIAGRFTTAPDLNLMAWQAIRDCTRAIQAVARIERQR